MSQPYHFLVQRADRLGDAIFSIPVIEALKLQYPDSTITVLSSSIGREVFCYHPDVDDVIVASENDSWRDILCLARQIKGKYTCYLSLWNHPKFAALGFLARIPIRIGDKTHLGRSLFYTHPVRQSWEQLLRHQIEFNLELLTPLFSIPKFKRGVVAIDPLAQDKVRSVFRVFQGAKTVLVFVGTGGTNSPFPESSVVELIRIIEREHPTWRVILAGQQSEDKQLYHLKHPIVHNMINQTSIQELFAYISQCDVYIGSDTGPTHIASFLNKPTVFFSSMKPNPPSRWGSLASIQSVIRLDYTCHFFCAKRCFSDVCFRVATGFVLYDAFHSVMKRMEDDDSQSLFDLRYSHIKHTLRVLHPFDGGDHLTQEGIKLFRVDHLSVRNIRSILRLIIRYNINVIIGETTPFLRALIRFYMGAIAVYQPPVFITRTSLPSSSSELIDYVGVAYEKTVPR